MIYTKRNISLKTIRHWLKNESWRIRAAALEACKGRDVPMKLIKQGLEDENWRIRAAAMEACKGRDVPMELIRQGLEDENWCIRAAALKACKGRDVPMELIKQGLMDENSDVRAAALKACEGKDVPLSEQILAKRTFEPPAKVYKKCENQVIVVAKIPKDAFVIGRPNSKCRASKATIVNIIGDCHGEKIGFSKYDDEIFYCVGDEIEIDDFDPSDKACSTGFHFFCTQEEAKNY